MPGVYTNGLPEISAPLQNGAAVTAPNGVYTNMSSTSRLPLDTNIAAGAGPESVAVGPVAIAAFALAMLSNQQTSTVHAATSNTVSGSIITEALTTAAGADYTFTLTNSLILTTTGAPFVQIRSGTNSAAVNFVLKSITNGSGSCVIVWTNMGTAAANGTMLIAFHIAA